MKTLLLPAESAALSTLCAGDAIHLSGIIYTARDAAHKRLVEYLDQEKPLPIDLCGAAIYYAGPTPAPQGFAIGACGPTTSARMDAYSPRLMREGHNVMIGKGPRNEAVIAAIKQTGSVYLAATGGAGALLAGCVQKAEVCGFEDLGTEAIRRLYIEGFPAIVAIDARGNSLYK